MCPPAIAHGYPGLVAGWYAGNSRPLQCMAYPVSPRLSDRRLTPRPTSGNFPVGAPSTGSRALSECPEVAAGRAGEDWRVRRALVETHLVRDLRAERDVVHPKPVDQADKRGSLARI